MINGIIFDPDAKVIPGAQIIAVNDATGVKYETTTNNEGIYAVSNLPPGPYRLQVSKPGFKTLIKPDIILNVQDAISISFTLPVGATSVAITVEGGAPLINTQDASVSTVVDRQFAENLPMNGRSFQSLIYLAPGVVPTPVNPSDGGQFSVNGQRPSSNYWSVDGVSANIGLSATPIPGNGFGGALGSFSALGGTNSLVSVDAMEEFRIQTSTYAPEFGRTPGGQISILTRSGTGQFHGTAFEYLRNDLFDANDWFANFAKQRKPEERQHDFGGTFSGRLLKDRTFFFFSYEGLRLRLPQVALDTVPDLAARQNAIPAMQPFLNAFPFDPNQPDLGDGLSQLNASYSNSANLDAYSLRLDHHLNDKWSLFGRYNYSPSSIEARGASGAPLSVVTPTRITTETATLGISTAFSASVGNDARLNYSRTSSSSHSYMDRFEGAIPLTALPFPDSFSNQNSFLALGIFALRGGNILTSGRFGKSRQEQFNFVDSVSAQVGRHGLKFGLDFRRLSPEDGPCIYCQTVIFTRMDAAMNGTPLLSQVTTSVPSTFLFRNFGLYAQDTWRAGNGLTLTYGLRWDVDFTPSTLSGPAFPAVTGYDPNDFSRLALARPGTTPFDTRFGNVAPRIGIAYQISQLANWQTVVRGGFGVFYDLASSETGNLLASAGYPFTALRTNFGGTFPLDSSASAPPEITIASLANCCSALSAFDPRLNLPYTLEWNVALEQGLGNQQTIQAAYIGASGRRLLETAYVFSPTPGLYAADIVGNTGNSSYDALQAQFQRRLTAGLQALASYTFSHSIDDGSAGSNALVSNTHVPGESSSANRGDSDFDIRHSFSAGITYEIPSVSKKRIAKEIFGGWSVQSFVIAFSAPPVDVSYSTLGVGSFLNAQVSVRPDRVAGQPLYLSGSKCLAVLGPPCAGGRGLNPAAFAAPPLDPATGNPLRQGNLGRNVLRGFGASQLDFAVHKEFPLREQLRLQFRAELFNALNHPNFGPPVGDLESPGSLSPQFGQSQFMLGRGLGGAQYVGSTGNGSFSPLYQIGGPRSVQFALKLAF